MAANPAFRPIVVKISISMAVVAWIVLMIFYARWKADPLVFCIIAWPVLYMLWLGMTWLVAKAACSARESPGFGQLLRSPIWAIWNNVAILALPLAILWQEALGMLGRSMFSK